jgi:acyl carrier protein
MTDLHVGRNEHSHDALACWLTAKVARALNVAPETIDVDIPLADYGMDSVASLALCADLEHEKEIVAETTIVWDYATIDAIAAHLATRESTR